MKGFFRSVLNSVADGCQKCACKRGKNMRLTPLNYLCLEFVKFRVVALSGCHWQKGSLLRDLGKDLVVTQFIAAVRTISVRTGSTESGSWRRSDIILSQTYLIELKIIRKLFSLVTDSWKRVAFNWRMYLLP